MHDQPTCGPELSPVDLNDRNRNDVLQHLLLEYPTPFSVDELIAELTSPGEESFGERDGFLNAIRDLRRCGLLHQHGEFVWPTRAAKGPLGAPTDRDAGAAVPGLNPQRESVT